MKVVRGLVCTIAGLLAGCAQMDGQPVAVMSDGQLPLPSGYRSWPVFLGAVQREDAKQIRDIFMNADAARARAGQSYPDGSLFVMENWSVKLDGDGRPLKGPDGKLVKDRLAAIFVMGKNAGWGRDLPEALRNGSWVYSAFKGSGELNGEARYDSCRTCHAPLKDKDFIARYDEHFASAK